MPKKKVLWLMLNEQEERVEIWHGGRKPIVKRSPRGRIKVFCACGDPECFYWDEADTVLVTSREPDASPCVEDTEDALGFLPPDGEVYRVEITAA